MTGQKTATRHPIFDPASAYGRMRNGVRADYKMRGYFHWLKARAVRLGLPSPEPRPGACLSRLAGVCRLVLDAWDCRSVVMPGFDRGFDHEATLCLVGEPDGTRGVGLAVNDPRPRPGRACVRAFLIEPEVLVQIALVIDKGCETSADDILACAFAPEMVAENLDIARLLAAIPDLEGMSDETGIRFPQLPIMNGVDALPPRQGPLTAVIVFDDFDG